MFERCIALESSFTPAYLELIKLRTGIMSGRLLREVVRLNPLDQDRLAQYGFWLLENGKNFKDNYEVVRVHEVFSMNFPELVLGALQQFRISLRIKETHQMSFVGLCRTLRKMGQTSRLHQIVSR